MAYGQNASSCDRLNLKDKQESLLVTCCNVLNKCELVVRWHLQSLILFNCPFIGYVSQKQKSTKLGGTNYCCKTKENLEKRVRSI